MRGIENLCYCREDRWAFWESSLSPLLGNLRDNCGFMLVGTLQLRSALRQMVNKVARHSALQRELMEECLCYLAKIEVAAPDREADWYLKRCGQHLARFRYLVRSWEGPKLPPLMVEKAAAAKHKRVRTPEEIRRFSEVVAALGRYLSKREKKILDALAEGGAAEEIAAVLKEELPFVVQAQRKIAALILKHGLVPKPERPRKKARGKTHVGKIEASQSGSVDAETPVVMMPAIVSGSEPPAPRARPS